MKKKRTHVEWSMVIGAVVFHHTFYIKIISKQCSWRELPLGELRYHVGTTPDLWSKSCEYESQQKWQENFHSGVNFVRWLLFGVCSTPMLPKWHVKDHGHSAKSAGDRLHLNTHTTMTQWSRSGLTMPLSRRSVGTYQETSSHATCQGTLSHSRLSSLSHCRLILT